MEEMSRDSGKAKKKAEQELDSLKKSVQDYEMSLRKVESEKQSKDHAIRALQVGNFEKNYFKGLWRSQGKIL
jgi:hypothetical protein